MIHPRRRRSKVIKVIVPAAAFLALAAVIAIFLFNRAAADDYTKRPVFAGTLAGLNKEFGETFGIAIRGDDIYVSDGETGEIKVVRGGAVSTFASGLNTPSAIAFASDGTLLTADAGSHTILSVDAKGQVSTIAGTEGKAGSTDGPVGEAQFRAPTGLAVSDGKIYVADTYNDRVRLIANGSVSTLAGGGRGFADGVGTEAKFDTPTSLAIWQDKVLVADSGNCRIRVVEPDGRVWTLAGSGNCERKDGLLASASLEEPTAIAVMAGGEIVIADGNAIRIISGLMPSIRTVSADHRGFRDGALSQAMMNRPSGLAIAPSGDVLVTDSDNRAVRVLSPNRVAEATPDQIIGMRETPQEFRTLQPPRWPFDPGDAKRDIAGTLGELRGEIKKGEQEVHFHNGLDIAGSYGETARFVRSEKVLSPFAAENFGSLRELIRLPTMGYIHIRLGRDAAGKIFDDGRFLFDRDTQGKLTGVRVPRGSNFKAGESIGTLNAMNHVHLIAGRSGSEMNALDALIFPGITDTRPPVIEKVTIADRNWDPLSSNLSTTVTEPFRLIIRAYDQVDGNSERRRLGIYKAGYQILHKDASPAGDEQWTIVFDRLPPGKAVPYVYAIGSRSGATGETIFNYIVSDQVRGDAYGDGMIDMSAFPAGEYIIRALAADYFGNTSHSDVRVTR